MGRIPAEAAPQKPVLPLSVWTQGTLMLISLLKGSMVLL